MLGGTASISNTFRSGDDSFNFSLSPNAGYFINDKIAIGGEVLLDISTSGGSSDVTYGLLPFLRYYFSQPSETLYLFGVGQIGILGFGGDQASQAGYTLLVGPGIDIMISPSVAVEGILGLRYTKIGDNSGATTLGVRFGIQVFLADL